jgi:hypothetical protein
MSAKPNSDPRGKKKKPQVSRYKKVREKGKKRNVIARSRFIVFQSKAQKHQCTG